MSQYRQYAQRRPQFPYQSAPKVVQLTIFGKAALTCAAIALVFLPIVGLIGVMLSFAASAAGEPYWKRMFWLNVLGIVLGTIGWFIIASGAVK
jgi:uncharacterized membrane protein